MSFKMGLDSGQNQNSSKTETTPKNIKLSISIYPSETNSQNKNI